MMGSSSRVPHFDNESRIDYRDRNELMMWTREMPSGTGTVFVQKIKMSFLMGFET